MSNINSINFAGKIAIAALGVATAVAMAFGSFTVLPKEAQAATLTEAQISSIISLLQSFGADQATINNVNASLRGQPTTGGGTSGGTTGGYVFTRDLTVGSTGADVTELQKILVASGHLVMPQGVAMGYFGPLTKAALAKWQAANAVSPAVGYFGPITRARLSGTTTGGGPVVIPGGDQLVVSASASQPANHLAPQNATRLPFTRVTLTAGSKDVTVSRIEAMRTGPGDDDNFSGVVLLDDMGNQIGLSRTLNSEHKVLVGEDFVIPAGTSKTVTIAGNIASSQTANAGQVVALSVTGVTASSPVSGTFPITGAAHTSNASLTIGTVTVDASSLANTDTTLEIGNSGIRFAAIRVTAGSAEDVVLRSIKWNQTGSASRNDLNNVVVRVDGVTYPTTVSSNGKYYQVNFGADGLTIGKGLSKDVTIEGDIIDGANRTIAFDIERNTDVFVQGKTLGFGITVSAGSTAAAADGTQEFTTGTPFFDAVVVTIQAGSVSSVSNATALAPAANVAINNPDTLLGAYQVQIVGEPITVAQTGIQFSTTVAGAITNIRIVKEDGTVVAGPVDLAAGGSATTSDTITYPTGITKYKILGKLPNSFSGGRWANGHTVTARTNPANHWSTVTGSVTGNTISLSSMSQQTLSQMTVRAAALTVTVSSQPPAQNIIAGATGVEFAKYILDGTQSGESIRVANIPLAYGGNGTATDLTSCQLYDGATSVTSGSNVVNPGSYSSSTTFSFDGGGLTINANSSKTLSLKCNVRSGITTVTYWGLDSGQQTSFTGVTGLQSNTTVTETLNDSNGQRMTATSGGSYTVTADNSVLYSAAQAGTSNVTLAKFRFDAGVTEGVKVKRVALELGSTASNSPNDLINQRVTLWNGATLIGEATFAGTNPDNATSTLDVPIDVPADGSVTITVKGDLVAHSSTLGTPGAHLAITYDSDADGLVDGNYGTGLQSGATIADTTSSDQTSNGVRIYRAVPTVEVTSSGCSGCLNSGTELYKVKITAPNERSIGIRAMTFDVTISGADTITFDLDGPSGNILSAYSTSTYTGVAAGVGGTTRLRTLLPVTSNDRIIPAGASKTYVLKANTVTGLTSANVETVTVRLLGDDAHPCGVTLMCRAVATSSRYGIEKRASTTDRFVWTPFSTTTAPSAGTAAMEALLDWTNSYGLPSFGAPGSDMPLQAFTHN